MLFPSRPKAQRLKLYSSQHGPQIGSVAPTRQGPGLVNACQAARTILERPAVVERKKIEFSTLLEIFALHRVVFACFLSYMIFVA